MTEYGPEEPGAQEQANRAFKPGPQQLLELEATILRLTRERGPGKTICPSDAARALAGKEGEAWGALMPAIRKIAVRLANEGRLIIMRKGKQVDPNDFKGIYRLGMTRED